jgi:hypothetical protein
MRHSLIAVDGENEFVSPDHINLTNHGRNLIVANLETPKESKSLDQLFNLQKYHEQGITGKGIKVAIFDSGLAQKYLDQNRA